MAPFQSMPRQVRSVVGGWLVTLIFASGGEGADSGRKGGGSGPQINDSPLSQAGVQAAFQILRQDYIRSDDLNFAELNRAALDGLLDHLKGGARVLRVRDKAERGTEPEVLRAVLAEGIGWLRPMTYAADEVALWTEALGSLAKQGCGTVLLDLREPAQSGAFEVAAAMLEALVPPGHILFRMKQAGGAEAELHVSSKEPVWHGQIVVLVDGGTNNVGEAVAAVLRRQQRAIVMGERTAGATVRYQTLPLDENHVLQYASAELLLEDGESLFNKGLNPDLKVVMSADEKKAARQRMKQGRVRELVHEVARERFNEAALVARRNPELEEYLKRSAGEDTNEEEEVPRDTVMQRAVDAVQAREMLDSSPVSWKAAGRDLQKDREIIKAPKARPVTGER